MVGLTAVAAWHPITSPDVFFHLDLGRAVLRSRSWFVPEPASFLDPNAVRVVPQWLWDIGAYAIHEAFGTGGLVVVTALIAALGTYLGCRLVARIDQTESTATRMVVSGLIATAVMSLSTVRPQTMFMALLPGWMLLCWLYDESTGSRRRWLAGALCALLLFWVHVHGSFVVAPVVWAIIVGPQILRSPLDLVRLRFDAGLALLFCAVLLTNAYGLGLPTYLLAHGASDAVNHNLEMVAFGFTWLVSQLLPTAMWVLALFGLSGRQRFPWREFGLLALGVFLAFEATRFVVAASILAAPLATLGAANIEKWAATTWPRARSFLPAFAALLLVLPIADWFEMSRVIRAPIGRLGLTPGEHPVLAAAFLKTVPAGTAVLSTYSATAQLGFWTDGHVRTYIDGRTPLHFGDTEFAVSRDIAAHEAALARAIERYGIGVAVVDRRRAICRTLDEAWTAIIVEGKYTTFAPKGTARPLVGIEACGVAFMSADACSRSKGLDAALGRLDALGPSPATQLMRAEQLLRCEHDIEAADAMLPHDRDAFSFRNAHRRIRIRLSVARGELDAAEDLLAEAIDDGDYRAISALGRAGIGTFPPAQAREVLTRLAVRMDDRTQPHIRASLARLCMRLEDVECARFQGVRAAVRGDERVVPVLEWLASSGRSEWVREDAKAWLDVLSNEAGRRERSKASRPGR